MPERGRHAERGNINGIENFLDIFVAMVRLLYVFHRRGYVNKHQFVGRVCRYVEIASSGFENADDWCDGYLRSLSDSLSGEKNLLAEVCEQVNFGGCVRAAFFAAQMIRFDPYEPSASGQRPSGPADCLPTAMRPLQEAFAAAEVPWPSTARVHARWIGPDGRTRVNALAVASEPYIFWRSEGAAEIIQSIAIPPEVGKLSPAAANLNGPSGVALDDLFLKPLGFSRADAWLCDLVPYSCMNEGQKAAIEREYVPLMAKHGLVEPTTPDRPDANVGLARRQEILAELRESKAELLVLLGDEPITGFLNGFDRRWSRLSDFGTTPETYGQRHRVSLDGLEIDVMPLAHPRQAAKLGRSSDRWFRLHQGWIAKSGR